MDIDVAVDAISTSGHSVARQREALATARKLMANVVEHPHEEKYRRVKKSTPAIQSRLFPQCFELLTAAGFQDTGDTLLYSGAEPGSQLTKAPADRPHGVGQALLLVEALLLSMEESSGAALHGGVAQSSPSAGSGAVAKPGESDGSCPQQLPLQSKRAQEQKRLERAKQEAARAQANSQQQLAALRKQRAGKYLEEQDTALAHHLSSQNADEPFDPITVLNNSRGAVHNMVSCTRCGSALRYSSGTRAQAVLCPCGMLLQPYHLQGQSFSPSGPSDLPVEPGEPLDRENRPVATRGPFITVRGPDGEPARLPLHAVLRMVQQHERQQQTGAGEETIEALPTRMYTGSSSLQGADADADGDKKNMCQICMEDFREGDELRTLPCFHLFHSQCVDQWLKVNSICPTCRHKVGG